MKTTVFESPVWGAVLRFIARAYLALVGWRAQGEPPDEPKYVMVAAPHTSNWDLPITLMIALVLRVKIRWMGKQAIFRWPFGTFFRWLGGVPVDRSRSSNLTGRTAEVIREADSFVLIVAPEGTRRRVAHWKTGFYHIARGANVPIVLGFLDFHRKVGGIGPTVHPTGNIEEDMSMIRGFYADITGKRAGESGVATVAVEP